MITAQGHSLFACLAAALLLSIMIQGGEDPWITYQGKSGPGQGKHIVFISGDEEYRSEEACPMLAKILAERHGFTCTVLFAIDPKSGNIDPWEQTNIPGLHLLSSADAAVIFLRFRELPDEQMKHIVDFVNSGKGIVGIRPSIAAFLYSRNKRGPYAHWSYNSAVWPGGFSKQVLGETWFSHHGAHGKESTRGVINETLKNHPILRGVSDIWGPTDVYGVRALPPGTQVLAYGQVLAGMNPDDAPVAGTKNDPMMPLAWTLNYTGESGNSSRVFYASMGASEDFQCEGLRRMVVNACYWATGVEARIPGKSDVTYVDPYRPSPYSLAPRTRPLAIRPADHALGRSDGASLAASLTLKAGDRIAFVGNSLAERMNLHGHFEAMLHSRFPMYELSIRNFGWPGDEAGQQKRPDNYSKIDDPLKEFAPDVFFCFFGFNESFGGASGLAKFRADLETFIGNRTREYARDGANPRFVIVSPIAYEPTEDSNAPRNDTLAENLRVYTEAMRETAAKLSLPFVDLHAPTAQLFKGAAVRKYTIDGVHLNLAGDRAVSGMLDAMLFGAPYPRDERVDFEALRDAVNDKSFVHFNDYRMVNGWYVYGGRRAPYGVETFPLEYAKLRAMAALRDRRIWNMARGSNFPAKIDDSKTGDLLDVKTSFGTKAYSEPREIRYLAPEEALKTFTLPKGYQINLFASEVQFPELANPVQIRFDGRGRLWALVMPTYPQWKPADSKPNDKLLIFEDSNGDGIADKMTVYAEGLHVPIGFEFFDGGVFITQPPQLLYLKDSDGDDRADTRDIVLDGFGSEDSHVGICAPQWSPGGDLYLLEGVAKSTTVETVYGPMRNHTPAVYRMDPHTRRLDFHIIPAPVNPWGFVSDRWGQGFVGDGTTANHYWATPLSGAPFSGRKSMDSFLKYSGARMRPMVGAEFVSSRHFPDEAQGNYLYGCVINMNGIPQFKVREEGSGFVAERIEDLVVSSDRNCRPVDPQFGPDGALYFADWHNALVGHMQYSQRDPNRDHAHGRIYRVTYSGRPLVTPVKAIGATIPALLEQLKIHEDRTRYAARRELRDRMAADVLPALSKWLHELKRGDAQYEHHLCEALWVQQGFHSVDVGLLKQVLTARDYHARAVAVHILGDERERLPNAFELLETMILDDHPRVRLEAVRVFSFFSTRESVEAVLQAVKMPLDYYLDYTLQSTLAALEPEWCNALAENKIALGNPRGLEYLEKFDASRKPGGLAAKELRISLGKEGHPDEKTRHKAMQNLAAFTGNASHGKEVFARMCIACHRINKEGAEFGPELTQVATRLNRFDLVESIIDPSAKIDPKFSTTSIQTTNGRVLTGFADSEDVETITIRYAAGDGIKSEKIKKSEIKKRQMVRSSNMPEGLAETMSPQEFTDLVEFLAALK